MSKHESWLFHLLSQLTQNSLLPGDSIFVPRQIPKRYIHYEGLVNGHVNYISYLQIIPIEGLATEAEEHTRVDKTNKRITYLNHVTSQINTISIQPTSRTEDIGKLLVIVKDGNYWAAEHFLGIDLSRTFHDNVPNKTTSRDS